MATFNHGTVEIAYLDEGEGEPIVLVHGFASTKDINWVYPGWVTTLTRARRRVIALDNRGHGQSAKLYDPADYHTEKMAGDVEALLDHLGIARADVMGYSMGARICAFLAERHPARVRAVVLGGLGIRLVDGVGLPQSIADALLAPSIDDVTDKQGRTFRAFAEQTKSDRQALAACIRGSRQTMTREEAAAIHAPVLVAVGTKDDVAGSPHELAALIPRRAGARYSGSRPHARGWRQGLQTGRPRFSANGDMTVHPRPAIAMFSGAGGNRLIADVFGERGAPVLLLHGGGQTRHAWRKTAEEISRSGRAAYAIDQRGHGDSDWIGNGAYTFHDYADDVRAVSQTLASRSGNKPAVIGASLGGIAALLAAGDARQGGEDALFSALVLVDITPSVDLSGVAKVQGFMREHAREGFATIAEAADVVAAYLPHRPRPPSHEGLKKNLRLHPDGRWRWHWDPRFLEGPHRVDDGRMQVEAELKTAAAGLRIPTLLVRGSSSELVQESHAKEFLSLVPHAEYADVGRRTPYGGGGP